MSTEHIVLAVAAAVFLAVAGLVGLSILVHLVQRSRTAAPKPPVATLYPVPPAERGTGQHVTLLDLFDRHASAEDARRRAQKLTDKLYDLVQEPPSAPKA